MFNLKFSRPRTGEKQRLIERLERDRERLLAECAQIRADVSFLQEQHRERADSLAAIAAALAAVTPEDRAIGVHAQQALEDELSLLDFSPETSPSSDEHPGRPLRGLTAAVACVGALFLASPVLAAGGMQDGAVAALIAKGSCPGVVLTDEKLGTYLYLAAAEMGKDINDATLSIAARSSIEARNLEKKGLMPEFCSRIEAILAN